MKKINPMLLVIIGILFIMSVVPGQGTKAQNQQAIVSTEYTCLTSADCPTCVGAGITTDEESFLTELNSKSCVAGICQQSDSCLVWDCGKSGNCISLKQTILDNTIQKINMYPFVLIGAVIFILIYKQLD